MLRFEKPYALNRVQDLVIDIQRVLRITTRGLWNDLKMVSMGTFVSLARAQRFL